MTPITWVVGAQGLLGRAVVRAVSRTAQSAISYVVPWDSSEAAVDTLGRAARELLDQRAPWRIAWCAGAGVIGTSQEQFDQEVAVLAGFLDRLRSALSPGDAARGALFVASSAGGVYAGSSVPPFTEVTPTAPTSPYGRAKLESERLAGAFAAATGVPVLIGRIANLYGPGQDIRKPQGLVSQLCRAHLTRSPISIYVPLDTARDYIYVDDAAARVVAGLERVATDGGVRTKILATGRPTTVAAILGELRRVTKRRPQVVLGASPNAKFQARDLRFRSEVWADLDAGELTPLAAGVAATLESLGQDLRAGQLVRR